MRSVLALHLLGFLFWVFSVTSSPISTNSHRGSGESEPSQDAPAISSSKLVVAHFMVGNAYQYQVADWDRNIRLAALKGIDGFALNVGKDSWQADKVAQAFVAAHICAEDGIDFGLFISFDMSSIPCSSASDASFLDQYLKEFQGHSNYLRFKGKPLVSAFSGENCKFGTGSLNEGWLNAIKNSASEPNHFVPSFFMDSSTFSAATVMDGAFNWNSAWPMGKDDISFASDKQWIDNLNGRSYMAGVSPWFSTHYSPQTYNKNFIYCSDDWLLSQRWDLLIQHRGQVDIAQVITWNDYGESSYVAPIVEKHDTQPNSQAWVDGFPHEGWLDLIAYYIVAFKTGQYPHISRDRIFLWGRLFPAKAAASDSVGRPANSEFSQDDVWAVFLLTKPSDAVLKCGDSHTTASLPAGLSKMKLRLKDDCSVSALLLRGDDSNMNFSPPGFHFRTDPPMYNFNAFVAASP